MCVSVSKKERESVCKLDGKGIEGGGEGGGGGGEGGREERRAPTIKTI
jgi:hypothetical protein